MSFILHCGSVKVTLYTKAGTFKQCLNKVQDEDYMTEKKELQKINKREFLQRLLVRPLFYGRVFWPIKLTPFSLK